ncbi:alpha-ketoglutarate-dependent dioxygenase AlkB family protein [Streptomyces europaeiscabiei]|uniref:alpha-ketoglutarate-dependent dioxygenase AlkB family protein n=1 Tax=Streptomyces europaeiscabiei TaxID=146819 RepID=UPI00062857FA|nr:alpha-ketoglutarate-dependent dioxygenase AlkB [Streptomyces europaeiscabiei]
MDAELFPRGRAEIVPGAVHVPDWLDAEQQGRLLDACRDWARPPAGLRTVRTPGGGTMTARQVCLGRHWAPVRRCPNCGRAVRDNPGCPGRHRYPYAYARTVVDGDGTPVKPFPGWLGELGRRAVADALGAAEATAAYDIALINFYDADARMGMHRDSDEDADAPVVSLSLGDTCVFRFGNTETRTRPYTDVELRSGDLFVFGGAARQAYHGVPRVYGGTAPAGLGLTGRLNVTLRVSGLGDG